ncbi:hypothetical protein GCM10025734_69490 [Kitasatospora paranensis]|uniref:AAA family ATPase n=1 Tax=Kitasatospora paranensis TaxID=258053 RepID=UPI0031ED7F69
MTGERADGCGPAAVRRPPLGGPLPAETTGLVGRQRELRTLASLVETSRLVTVTGPGGVGKSRLALRAAADAAGDFPDGACFAEVGPVQDPLLLGHALLEALRLTDATARPPLDVLVEQLADRRMLLVLDGCEHLVGACAELVGALLRSAPVCGSWPPAGSRCGWRANTCCHWGRCRWSRPAKASRTRCGCSRSGPRPYCRGSR